MQTLRFDADQSAHARGNTYTKPDAVMAGLRPGRRDDRGMAGAEPECACRATPDDIAAASP
jgi:hypothetical protein